MSPDESDSGGAQQRASRATHGDQLAQLPAGAVELAPTSELGSWRARVLAATTLTEDTAADLHEDPAGIGALAARAERFASGLAGEGPGLASRWRALIAGHTHVTGALGTDARGAGTGAAYALQPESPTAPSCIAAHQARWAWAMLRAEGHRTYADALDGLLHNTLAAAVSLGGDALGAWNPLQRRADVDEPVRTPAPPACCATALAELAAAVGEMTATGARTAARLHLYATGTIRIGASTLEVTTDYPWDGRVTVEVTGPLRTLGLRIPGWSASARLEVDGEARPALADADGYVSVDVTHGSSVVLELDMAVTVLAPHPRIDSLRACVALARGPVLHCLEQGDLPPGIDLADVRLFSGTAPHAGPALDALHAGATVLAEATVHPADGTSTGTAHPCAWPPVAGSGMLPARIPVRAIPYARWANRGVGAMRVWIPIDQEGISA